jgi:hypothetical protein
VTVRQRIDQMAAEPPVGDLGYAADQRLVASALLGLQLLADEIDAIKAGATATVQPAVADVAPRGADGTDDADDAIDLADVVAQLADLVAQVRKLNKAVKRGTGKEKKKPKG